MMCINCLQGEVDVTEGITRQVSITWCKQCDRYLRPPWFQCAVESRELLGLCLKKIKGLNKVKVIDACFLYTEPHSRRLKVKITIQREVTSGAVLQQSVVVEVVVMPVQCDDCKKVFTPHTWNACVQVRQKVSHKRTLYYLEQLILKYQAHEKVTGVKQAPDGLDFQFHSRSHALSFNDFVQSSIPIKTKESKTLVSHDGKSNSYNFKYTIYAELCPVCRDDLIRLDAKQAQDAGGLGRILVCSKVAAGVHLIDPSTCRTWSLCGNEYWKHGFQPVCQRDRLQKFYVLDVEPVRDETRRKVKPRATKRTALKRWQLCEAEVCREADIGQPEKTVRVRCHLGNLLKVGDMAYGYDLRAINVSGDEFADECADVQNDVILVKKCWTNRDSVMSRPWKLKRLDMDVDEGMRVDEEKDARDEEAFKRDIEEDESLQKEMNLYRDPSYVAPIKEEKDDDESDDGLPEVALANLIDDLSV